MKENVSEINPKIRIYRHHSPTTRGGARWGGVHCLPKRLPKANQVKRDEDILTG